ncbi:glycosyltransferase family 4 protein [Oenococcus oeni]
MKKIAFVLPPFSRNSIGGYKTVFQYANEFVKRGYRVDLYYLSPLFLVGVEGVKTYRAVAKHLLQYDRWHHNLNWFILDSHINSFFMVTRKLKGQYDYIIATSVQTAIFVNELKLDISSKKIYYIQGYEDWVYKNNNIVDKSFSFPLTKVVISKWLQNLVFDKSGDFSQCIPNFINPRIFYVDNPIKKRGHVISLLNHVLPEKNFSFGLKVVEAVQKKIPDLRVLIFGVPDAPARLPDFCSYVKAPNQSQLRTQIYNQSSIYLLPSIYEGWGLTGMEAMACGATLVASDIGGIQDYAIDGVNASLLPVNNFDAFVNTICVLLKRPPLKNSARIGWDKNTE